MKKQFSLEDTWSGLNYFKNRKECNVKQRLYILRCDAEF